MKPFGLEARTTGMKSLYVVDMLRGPAWESDKPIRKQALWDEHAAFMDELTENGFVMLGGPLGDEEAEAMLVVNSPDEAAVHAMLARDPWRAAGLLSTPRVRRWTIFLESSS